MKKTSLFKLAAGILLGTYVSRSINEFNKGDHNTKIKDVYRSWSLIYDYLISPWNYLTAHKAEKELNKFLKKNVKKKASILDLACGTGVNYERIKKLKIKYSNYLGLDLSEGMLVKAKEKSKQDKKAKFVIQDVLKFNTNNKYDLIISTWALSHMPDPYEFIKKYMDHLKKGGHFALIYQSAPKKFNIFIKIIEKISNIIEAPFVDDEKVDIFIDKAILDKEYLDGYVRLIIFQK